MPLVTSPASPWESYPFRHHSVASTNATGSTTKSTTSSSQQNALNSHPKLNSQPSLRDLTISPSSRPSVSGAGLVGSRGSLSSLGSIGTISSRASMASLGSLPNTESSSQSGVSGSEGSLNVWQHEDGANNTPTPAKTAIGPVIGTGSPIGSGVSLSVSGLPRDLTIRESHYIFALAPDFMSVELNRNAVSGEVTLVAKFSTLHGAQHANQLLERRIDIFGGELKTSVQSYASPFIAQSNTQRSIYPSRPLFAESYWSQQPTTPLSPSNAGPDYYSGSRRPSAISSTETVHSAGTLGYGSIGSASSPSHHTHFETSTSNSAPPFANNVQTNATVAMTGSASTSPCSSIVSPTSGSSQALASAIGTGVPTPSTASSGSSISHRPSLASLTSSGNSQVQGSTPQNSSQTPVSSHNTSSQSRHGLLDQNLSQSPSSHSQHHFNADSQKIPPPNPADQNPPCNTLYVGNLPPDTSEAELKDLFSRQPGYRRLCFRTKQNGPMCFVEFDDEKLAGKALSELYGHVLSNSVKGGIRLSYSKNPLGVRSRPARR